MIRILPFESASNKVGMMGKDFPFKYRVLETEEEIKSAFDERRGQYSAHHYLSHCRKVGREKDTIVLGITDVDLYVPELNFVFGLAEKNGFGCVISTNRLGKGKQLTERMIKESVHEIGHVMGLEHCFDRKCVMYFSNSLSDTDRKTGWFCNRCLKEFERKISDRSFGLDY